MAKKKITTKRREDSISRNKARNTFQLHDNELSDVSVKYVCDLFMLRQKERGKPNTFYRRVKEWGL